MCLSLAHPGSILLDLRWWQSNAGTLADLSAVPDVRPGMSQPQTSSLPLLSIMWKFGFCSLSHVQPQAQMPQAQELRLRVERSVRDVRVGDFGLQLVCAHMYTCTQFTHICTYASGSFCVTQCDKDKAQTFSQQGLCSLFVLLQIFVTPRKWPLPPPSQLSVISGPAVV